MNIFKKIINFIKQLSLIYKIIGCIIILITVFAILNIKNRKVDVSTTVSTIAHVDVTAVSSLSDKNSSLSLTGKVSSVSKATILAVSSGEIVSLSHSLGDYVNAGSIIASFENSSQRASLLQAKGMYDSAVASQKSVSPIDTKTTVVNIYKSTYNILDSILTSQVDMFFVNPGKYSSSLLISTYPYPDNKISKERDILRDEMIDYQKKLLEAENSDPNLLLKDANYIVQEVSNILNELTTSANTPGSQVTSLQSSSLSSARSSINTLISTLTATQQSYRSQSIITTSSVEANVTTALGGLNAAQSNLEKTFVRAPISGTIVSLPITKGGYVSSFSQVAQISNPDALEVDVYITSDDAKTLVVGSKAMIDESTSGVIVFIAPALDPTTGKILVKIGLSKGQDTLIDGDTVTITLDRNIKTDSKIKPNTAITIPIVTTKITPTGPIVFTVSESNTLIANKVIFGDILGGQVTILSGINPDMKIVKDARGLIEGQEVIINLTK